MSALIDQLIVSPCLCGHAHIVQTGQSREYFAWRNYMSERAPAADTGSSASEHVKAIGKSGCTLTPGELSRRMRKGTTQEEVLQWIQEVAGITDRDVLRQFYELFTAARRPAPHTQVASVGQKRKHAAAVAELPSDAGSSRSAADAPEASESASQPAVLQSGSSTAPFGDGISCRYRRCPPAIARTCVAGPHHILRARPVASLQQRDVQLLSDRVPHPPSRILPERDVQEGYRLRHGDVAHASQLLRNGRNA